MLFNGDINRFRQPGVNNGRICGYFVFVGVNAADGKGF